MRIALITGAASGIGYSTCNILTERGWKVIAIDRNDNLPQKYKKNKFVHTWKGDVSDAAMWEKLASFVKENYKKIDALVNCAAILDKNDAGIRDLTTKTCINTLKTNVLGTILSCKYCLPFMEDSSGASIVNVSSITGLVGSSVPQLAYTASKGAIISFSRELAVELAPQQIRVNVVCPGLTDTPMTNDLPGGTFSRSQRILLKRWASPDEIANVIIFLVSGGASYMTGSVVVVDGGITATNTTTEFVSNEDLEAN